MALLDDLQGPGAYSPLDEDGYQTTAATCCNYQMETFIRRLIDSMDLELCGEGELMGFVPYFSCEKGIQDFNTLYQELTDGPARTAKCPVAAVAGECPTDTTGCPGEPDPTYHRRRNCKSATTTTTSTTSTTGPTTTTRTTTTITTTTITTTTTIVTTTLTTSTLTTTVFTTTTMTTTTSTGCKGEVDLNDFFDSALTHSNLGGRGPQDGVPNIRYEGIGVKDGVAYDMVVTATSDYTPAEVLLNGYDCGATPTVAGTDPLCINGRLGAISVTKGTSVDLQISFQDSRTQNPLTLTSFLFFIFDVDQFNSKMKEKVYITGFSGTPIVANGTEVNVVTEADGRTSINSRQEGTAADNPSDPVRLGTVAGVDQKKRSVAFLFENTDTITLTFEVTCDACAATTAGEIGRTFLFGGDTNLVTCAGRS
jgi:hypothetical protein